MQKYIENEMNSNESLVEYEYHIDDITLLGFKILKLPLKQSDWPTWFSNFINKTEQRLRYLNYSREYVCISDIANDYKRENTIYNHLNVGDYIIYDSRFDKVYATDYNGILNIFNTITGYTYELLLDAAFESGSNTSDTEVNDHLPVITTEKDNINPNHYKFGEFQPVETPHVKDAIKYLIRYPRKNGLEDLKKAQWFINHLIEVREKIESSAKEKGL